MKNIKTLKKTLKENAKNMEKLNKYTYQDQKKEKLFQG